MVLWRGLVFIIPRRDQTDETGQRAAQQNTASVSEANDQVNNIEKCSCMLTKDLEAVGKITLEDNQALGSSKSCRRS
jgi:hypothetical protein